MANLGVAADSFDANGDGEINFLEFATGPAPNAPTRTATPIVRSGVSLEYTYTRSSAALAEGVIFLFEWTDTLDEGSGSNTGVTEQVPSNIGGGQTVKATLPAGGSGRRFVPLEVSRP